MFSAHTASEQVKDRGPRWAVIGTIRQGEARTMYADDAERAEVIREKFEQAGYYMIQVHPPQGSVDLAALGKARTEARRVLDEQTNILRAGVLRALEEGRAEAEVARQAGVDRMTVRKWAGK